MEINKEGNGNEILQMRSKTNPLDLCWDATFSIMEKWLNSLKKKQLQGNNSTGQKTRLLSRLKRIEFKISHLIKVKFLEYLKSQAGLCKW